MNRLNTLTVSMSFLVQCNYSLFAIPLQCRLLRRINKLCQLQCRSVDWFLCWWILCCKVSFQQFLIQFPHHWFRVSMFDNFAFNSVLLCDISLTLHFKMFFLFYVHFLAFFMQMLFFISRLDFSNNIERSRKEV